MIGKAVELLCGRHRLTDGHVVLKVHLRLFECAHILTHICEENLHVVLTACMAHWEEGLLLRENTQNWWLWAEPTADGISPWVQFWPKIFGTVAAAVAELYPAWCSCRGTHLSSARLLQLASLFLKKPAQQSNLDSFRLDHPKIAYPLSLRSDAQHSGMENIFLEEAVQLNVIS